ncbi:MAG: imelysin family protein [Sulfurimonadaceae bacterium]
MKKIIFVLLTFLTALFASENAQENILNKVLIVNTQKAIQSSLELEKSLGKKPLSQEEIQKKFSRLLFDWKKVEALYIAGELDNDYLDTPRYIDVFHNLKENLHEQMQRVRQSRDEVSVALFKHSFKTINALEYMLYSSDTLIARDIEISKAIVQNIQKQLKEILEVYQTKGNNFTSNEVFANGLIMNTLVQSIYKLKEWRVADVAGLSLKYKNNPNANRAEYFLSQNSTVAIEAILLAHQEVLDSKTFFDFGDKYERDLKNNDIKKTRELLKNALSKLEKIPQDDLSSNEAQAFYESVNEIYNHYFFTLIQDLKITAKILDADGD